VSSASGPKIQDQRIALAAFAEGLERFFRDNYTALVRQHLRLGTVEDVQDAIQQVFLRLYQQFAEGSQREPDNLAAYVNAAIRNALIDRLRLATPISLSELSGTPQNDANGGAEDASLAQLPDPTQLSPEEALAWKQLLHTIFARLPPKSVEVAAMVMSGKTPPEIGSAFGQNGYVLRRYARELICKILGDLASNGEPLARSFGRRFVAPGLARNPFGPRPSRRTAAQKF